MQDGKADGAQEVTLYRGKEALLGSVRKRLLDALSRDDIAQLERAKHLLTGGMMGKSGGAAEMAAALDALRKAIEHGDSSYGLQAYGLVGDAIANLQGRPGRAQSGASPIGVESSPWHEDDFTLVDWYGTSYRFSLGQQADCIRLLWNRWEKKRPGLSQAKIAELIESQASSFRLCHVFRRRRSDGGMVVHPAWGTMIKPVGKGVYSLQRPPDVDSPNTSS